MKDDRITIEFDAWYGHITRRVLIQEVTGMGGIHFSLYLDGNDQGMFYLGYGDKWRAPAGLIDGKGAYSGDDITVLIEIIEKELAGTFEEITSLNGIVFTRTRHKRVHYSDPWEYFVNGRPVAYWSYIRSGFNCATEEIVIKHFPADDRA